jgi:hypothetical protein
MSGTTRLIFIGDPPFSAEPGDSTSAPILGQSNLWYRTADVKRDAIVHTG